MKFYEYFQDIKEEDLRTVDELYEKMAYLDELSKIKLSGKSDTERKQYYKDMINGLGSDAVKSQVMQMLNYDENIGTIGRFPFQTLLLNCVIKLEKYITDSKKEDETSNVNFIKSLDESYDCIADESKVIKTITNLDSDNNSSFVMLPIKSRNHMFSTVVYKNKEGMYEFVVINKGAREVVEGEPIKEHHTFEKYIIQENNIGRLIDCFDSENSTSNIYDMFRFLSNKHEVLKDIDAKNQMIGNCYYKEIEAGLKYAYSRAYNKYELENYISNDRLKKKEVKVKVPKFPEGMQNFNVELIKNIRENIDNDELKIFIDNVCDVYMKNKEFRNYTKQNHNVTMSELKQKFEDVFGNSEHTLKENLQEVDLKTFINNTEFFIDLMNEAGIYIPMDIVNLKYTKGLRTKIYSLDTNNIYNKEFLKMYFPQVYHSIFAIKGTILLDVEVGTIYNEVIEMDEAKGNRVDTANKLEKKTLKLMNKEVNIAHKGDIYYCLATIKMKQRQVNEAMKLYTKAYNYMNSINGNRERTYDIFYDYSYYAEEIKRGKLYDNIKRKKPKITKLDTLKDKRKALDNLLEQGKKEEALNVCNNILSINCKDVSTMNKKVDILLEKKNNNELEEALNVCNNILELMPENKKVMRKKMHLLMKLNRLDELKQHFINILKKFPKDYQAIMNITYMLTQENKEKGYNDDIFKIIDKRIKETKTGIKSNGLVSRFKLKLYSRDIELYTNYQKMKITCLRELGENQKALTCCEKLIKFRENCLEIHSKFDVVLKKVDDIIPIKAEILYDMGRLPEAVKEYNELMEYHNCYENDRTIRERITDISQEIADVQELIEKEKDVISLSVKQINCMYSYNKLYEMPKREVEKLSINQIENLNSTAIEYILDKLSLEQLKHLSPDVLAKNTKKIKDLDIEKYNVLEKYDKLSLISKNERRKLKMKCYKNKDNREEKNKEQGIVLK